MTKEEYDQKRSEIEEYRNQQGEKMEEIAGKEEMQEGDFEAYHEARSNVESANKNLEALDAEYGVERQEGQETEQGAEKDTEIEEYRNQQGEKMEEIAGKEEFAEGDFEAYHEARSNVESANKYEEVQKQLN